MKVEIFVNGKRWDTFSQEEKQNYRRLLTEQAVTGAGYLIKERKDAANDNNKRNQQKKESTPE